MAKIDKARWSTLSPLLNELLEAPAPERSARLAVMDAEDPGLAAELASLLDIKAQIETEGFLERSPLEMLVQAAGVGRTVGSYTLEREIGAGGMGTVWLARRSDGRYAGRAAVKLLNLALLGRAGIERFRREGNALARLAHPNIAHLVDAGTVDGQPFLVLEYIDGVPIDTWCDTRKLDAEARVQLFGQVLGAVAYAHSQLILHRDLKPSNILVTPQGQVKLLDFGIARLLDESSSGESSEVTQLAGRALTPDYAAPEQVQGQAASTATDVYALGVVLFHLLAGAHPTARAGATQVERLRAIVEDEPRRSSDAAAAADAATAQARGTTAQALARRLRGDLDNIVAKALKKAPAERYATADAFAADLQRFLVHEPVSARGDSRMYRLGKFVRRNRLVVSATAIVVVALLAGVGGIVWQAAEAQRQRVQAVQERDRAQTLLGRNRAIAEFVHRMFTESLPQGEAALIQRMLERGEAMVARDTQLSNADRAELLHVLGSYYAELENAHRADELLRQARALVERDGDPSLKAQLACAHAIHLYLLNRRDEGARLLEQWGSAPGVDDETAANCLEKRAGVALNASQPQEAIQYANLALKRARAAPQPLVDIEAEVLGDIGFALHLSGRSDEAAKHYATAMTRLQELGMGHGHTARRMMSDWANASYGTGNFKRGLALLEEVAGLEERLNPGQIANPATLANHAFGLEQIGRYEAALAQYEQAAGAAERSGERLGQAYALVGQASALVQSGRGALARTRLAESAQLAGATLPETHPISVRSRLVRAQIDAENGALDAATAQLTAVIELFRAQGLSHSVVANAYRQRAELALRQADLARARSDVEQALELARHLQGSEPYSSYTGLALLTLARVEQKAGNAQRAQEALRGAAENLSNTLGAEHPSTVDARAPAAR
jgi:serine/threonine-protein kinase